MKSLLVTLGFVFLIPFLATPTMGAGWYWDFGNGIGFAAFAGLIYLGVTSYRRLDVRAHQVFGYAVLLLVVAHVFWFLLGDAAAIDFLKIGAPDYMWLGLIGLISLFVLVTVALVPDRLRVHKDYAAFRYWHQVLAIVTITSSGYHVAVSGFYLNTWYQALCFVLMIIIASFGRSYWIKLGTIRVATPVNYLFLALVFSGTFSAIRNWSA